MVTKPWDFSFKNLCSQIPYKRIDAYIFLGGGEIRHTHTHTLQSVYLLLILIPKVWELTAHGFGGDILTEGREKKSGGPYRSISPLVFPFWPPWLPSLSLKRILFDSELFCRRRIEREIVDLTIGQCKILGIAKAGLAVTKNWLFCL